MNRPCRDFRDRLSHALGGRALGGSTSEPTGALRTLAWHEHLRSCTACRAVLEAEEALEALLASLPEPRLPAGLTTRVLERLALDRLLETATADPAPDGLSTRMLARLEGARADAALDRLLDRMPTPVAPPGLAERTLAALAPEREGRFAAARSSRAAHAPRRWGPLTPVLRLAAALALLIGGGLGLRALLREEPTFDGDVARRDRSDTPPAELLESLDLLESWELITDDSLDVVLTSLDTADEVLLELDQGSDPLEPLTEEPSKG